MKKFLIISVILPVLFLFACGPNDGSEPTVSNVSLSTTAKTLVIGFDNTFDLVSTVKPAVTNKAVTWSTSNDSIASINDAKTNENGQSYVTVTGKAEGTATITVALTEGGDKATCVVTVREAIVPTSVALSKETLALYTGRSKQLTAAITPSNADNKKVTWSSSNEAIATVSTTGVVSGVAEGTATITVTTEAGSKTNTCAVTVSLKEASPNGVAANGQLSVKDGNLVNKDEQQFQLYGMSTHGIAWYPKYVSEETFATLSDDWNTNCVRVAMYTAEGGGYGSTPASREGLKTIVKNAVQWATELDMYVIIDWHVLNDGNGSTKGSPLVYKDEAKEFFGEMSLLYKDNVNVLYEICNEPNGSGGSWENVTTYASEVIPVIRENSANAVIIVGTPTWSQDIDKAQTTPLSFQNVMYALHFYAGTHKDNLRTRLTNAHTAKLPVFVSEFAICDSSGNGTNDKVSGEAWMKLINDYNLSYMAWNLANKNESSSVIKSSVTKISDWEDSDLTEWGQWIKGKFGK